MLAEQPGLGRPRSDLRHVIFYRPIDGGIEVARVHGKRDIGVLFAGRGD